MSNNITFYDCLLKHPKDFYKASVLYCTLKGWTRDQWFDAWQKTDLPKEVEAAVHRISKKDEEDKNKLPVYMRLTHDPKVR